MVVRREHEAEPQLVDAARHRLRLEVDAGPESLEHVRRSGLAGGRAVAVLGHSAAGPRGDEGGGGRHVEGRASAPRARRIHEIVAPLGRNLDGQLAHRARHAGDFGHRLALGPECDQQARRLRLRGSALHHLAQHGGGLVGGQGLAAAEPVDGLGENRIRHQRERKFRSICLPALGEHRLGMKLDSLGGEPAVAHAHHGVAVVRGALELVRKVGIDHQRVVAPGHERRLDPLEDGATVVGDLRRLSVHGLAAYHAAAERLGHRLVAEADPEHRNPGLGEASYRLHRHPRLGRRAGARRDDHLLRAGGQQLVDGCGVVAHHLWLGSHLAQILHEVERERVVVVDHQDAHQAQSGCAHASSIAPNTAPALASVSRTSY